MTDTRIRWEPTEYGGFTGYVGMLEQSAFYIYKPEREGEQWLLSAAAFLGARYLQADSADELRAAAERWLSEFVSSLGAVFPEDDDGTAVDDLVDRHEPPGGQWHFGPRVAECAFCTARIRMIADCWTADDGTIACTDTSAPFVPHKPQEAGQ